jgi:integrase
MASVFKRGRDRRNRLASWYITYVDATGRRRTKKACPDRAASEALARKPESEAALRRRGVIDPKADGFAIHEARPLGEHLVDYHAALVAKGSTKAHARKTATRAGRIIDLGGAKRISDLSLSRALSALSALRDEGLSRETLNHHVRAVKAFSRWLWKDSRARDHALAHLSTVNPESDRRRRRRALTADEAAALVNAAESGPMLQGIDGPTRAIAYCVALATGFRASELRSLTPRDFRLSESPPTITCAAAYTKNRHSAEQPIPESLAALLTPWVASLPADRNVFPLPERTADMIRADLAAAGVPYETDSGVVDFHAIRNSYVSELVRSGASVKACQMLARHSTPALTIGLYAKVDRHDLAGVVNSLPDLTRRPDAREAGRLAATGTESVTADCHDLAAHWQRAGDGNLRSVSETGGTAPPAVLSGAPRSKPLKPQQDKGFCASGRGLSVAVGSAGGGSRTHTGVAPQGILSPRRLPFRHAGPEPS